LDPIEYPDREEDPDPDLPPADLPSSNPDTVQHGHPALEAPDGAREPAEQQKDQESSSFFAKAGGAAKTTADIVGGVTTAAQGIKAFRKYLDRAKIKTKKYPKVAKLQEVRARKQLTQKRLADEAGVSRSTISKLEQGSQRYDPVSVYKIAGALGVEATELLEPIRLEPIPA
jgi:DNA-binding XRE family transcriptional regulator